MSKFDEIYEIAAGNYGLVTAAEAAAVGAATSEVSRYLRAGWLERVGRGVYRLTRYIPTPYDDYAAAVTLVGPGSYLYGESVLALHGLVPASSGPLRVATCRRVRRGLPKGVIVVRRPKGEPVAAYMGIPSQSVANAIRSCEYDMVGQTLRVATDKAFKHGLVSRSEHRDLMRELG